MKHVLDASLILFSGAAMAQVDPGVRGGAPGAGQPVAGANAAFFAEAKARFSKTDGVADGLGFLRFDAGKNAILLAQLTRRMSD